jgi:hypothetical protein
VDEDDRAARVRRLVSSQATGAHGSAEQLAQMCAALARALPATGVAITLIVDHRPGAVVAASDPLSERLAELQLTLGEGPSADAAEARRPVLEPDLGARIGLWPAFGAGAQAAGVRAVFAFPIQVGEARLGVVDIYREETGSLTRDQLLDALAFARVALDSMLDNPAPGDGHAGEGLLARNSVLYQAQGMVMIQLGVSLVEALSRIRAHAFLHDLRLTEVAHDIVGGRVKLGMDEPHRDG